MIWNKRIPTLLFVTSIPLIAFLYIHNKNSSDAANERERRKLLAIHEWVETTFVITNGSGIKAYAFEAFGLVPDYLGLRPAYEQLVKESLQTFTWTKYIDGTAEFVNVVDIPCPSCVTGNTFCQRVEARFEMGMHIASPDIAELPQTMKDIVDEKFSSGYYRESIRRLIFDTVNGNPVCDLVDGEGAVIEHPAGVDAGSIDVSNDLGLRFSKNPMLDPPYWEVAQPIYYDLGPSDYPLNMELATVLRNTTAAVSVFHGEDCLECDMTLDELVAASKVVVTFPTSDSDSTFWNELWEVMFLQLHRTKNGDITPYLNLPKIWTGMNIHQVADAVHDEFPTMHHINLINQLFGGALDTPYHPNCNECSVIDRTIIPSRSSAEFIRGIVLLADLCTWAFGVVGPLNFQTKWAVGRPRPEEVVWKIYNNELTSADGVPSAIVDVVKNQFHMNRMQDFTAYREGSPDHPSFPAMHSASSAASLWLALVLDLTHEQWCEVKAVDYAVSYARTVAGVHYYTDNIAGLNIGQEILARKMPDYLAEKYGSDKEVVAEKIARLRFDWNDYLTSDCFP